MGGNMQAQGHLQLAMSVIDDALSPQEASDTPRWRINDEGRLTVEAKMPEAVLDALRAKGHDLRVMPADSTDFGSAQAIGRLGDSLTEGYRSASDHRRDGQAVGF
jgi:gamma-glutamyltranspeptidase/glutathione hydrolase